MTAVRIGDRAVGDGQPCYVIAEIGINHNGDVALAKRLISVAAAAGCDAVKFQKRTIDVVYTPEELAKPRESPVRRDQRRPEARPRVRPGPVPRDRPLLRRTVPMAWFASCWDEASVDFIDQFDPPCYKIASASLTDDDLLRHTRAKGKPIILSTGMSTLEQIDHAVEVLGKQGPGAPAHVQHLPVALRGAEPARDSRCCASATACRSATPVTRPASPSSVAAVALGACMVERHITLDRAMWGSDQAASLEPNGIKRLVRDIRLVETSMGDGVKRVVPQRESRSCRSCGASEPVASADSRRSRSTSTASSPTARSGGDQRRGVEALLLPRRHGYRAGEARGLRLRPDLRRRQPAGRPVRRQDADRRRRTRAARTRRGAAGVRRRSRRSTCATICFMGDDVNDLAAMADRRPGGGALRTRTHGARRAATS